jgi:pimeloyl-ACP methyl ester carboxylesterase
VLAAVAELRRQGAHSIALAGRRWVGRLSSSPQAATQRSAAWPVFPGRAIWTVSPPGLRCRDCVCPRFCRGKEDSPYVDDARAMYRAATADKKLLVVPGSDHGTGLLDDERVGDQLLAFLTGR